MRRVKDCLDASHAIEDELADGHGHEGLEYGPYRPQKGLLIAHFDLSPRQVEQEFPIAPAFCKAGQGGTFLRLDDCQYIVQGRQIAGTSSLWGSS